MCPSGTLTGTGFTKRLPVDGSANQPTGEVHMAVSKNKNGTWRASFMLHGKRKSGTFKSKTEAQKFERDTRAKIEVSKGSTGGAVVVADVLQRYADTISPEKRGHKWEKVRLERIARENPIGKYLLEDVDVHTGIEHIEVLKQRGLKASSIAREMTLLKSVMRQCLIWYKLPYPWHDLKNPKGADSKRKRLISPREQERFVERSGYVLGEPPEDMYQRTGAIFMLAIETAMRLGEICQLTPRHLDLNKKIVKLESNQEIKIKGDDVRNVDRDVPLSPIAMQIIMGLDDVGPYDLLFDQSSAVTSTVFARLREWEFGKMSPRSRFTFHDTRHAACTQLSRVKGMDILKLAAITGHTDPTMLKRYYNEDMSLLANLLENHSRADTDAEAMVSALLAQQGEDALKRLIEAATSGT